MPGGERVKKLIGFSVLVIAALLWMIRAVEPIADPYCRMVEIYRQTDGEHGWPDYRGNADEVCDD